MIETVFLDVVDHVVGGEVVDVHLPPKQQPYFGAGDFIGDDLRDTVDIILPLLETGERFVDVGARPLHDEDAEVAQDVFEIASAPHAWLGHAASSSRSTSVRSKKKKDICLKGIDWTGSGYVIM